MLFPFSNKSKKTNFFDSKVKEAAKFLPTIHYHSPSPLLKFYIPSSNSAYYFTFLTI